MTDMPIWEPACEDTKNGTGWQATSDIQRLTVHGVVARVNAGTHAEFVTYADHVKKVKALEADRDFWKAALDTLHEKHVEALREESRRVNDSWRAHYREQMEQAKQEYREKADTLGVAAETAYGHGKKQGARNERERIIAIVNECAESGAGWLDILAKIQVDSTTHTNTDGGTTE